MEYLPTFENYSNAIIATVMTNGNDFIVTGLGGKQISRRSISYGEILLGFSTDVIVTKRGDQIFSFTPEFNRISAMTLSSGTEFRGVIGPNILVFNKSANMLITYDVNFRRLASHSVI